MNTKQYAEALRGELANLREAGRRILQTFRNLPPAVDPAVDLRCLHDLFVAIAGRAPYLPLNEGLTQPLRDELRAAVDDVARFGADLCGAIVTRITELLEASPGTPGPMIRTADFGPDGLVGMTAGSGHLAGRIAALPKRHFLQTVLPTDQFMKDDRDGSSLLVLGRYSFKPRPWYSLAEALDLTRRLRTERQAEAEAAEQRRRADAEIRAAEEARDAKTIGHLKRPAPPRPLEIL
jgi:hypothetical protein